MFTSFAIFPCIYAQTHDKTLYELTKQSPKIEVSHIDAGKEPFTIKYVANEKVYVANSGSNTVSVINATTNEKIKDIVVGDKPTPYLLSLTQYMLLTTALKGCR